MRFYSAIAALETVMPGLTPPCNCRRKAPEMSPAIPEA
jgi:hypothetical protein